MQESLYHKSFHKLLHWIDQNGWKGYDPYDLKGIKWVIRLTRSGNKNFLYAALRELVFELFYTFPVTFRRLFRIKSQVNAKAMGLFGMAYLDLYKLTKNPQYLSKTDECLAWLLNNKREINNGVGWGYPFDWQSTGFIPAYTPNGIVTTAVGDVFWQYYQHSKKTEYLDICTKIAIFLDSLPVDTFDHGICYSYTPVFKNHVHNLNLFIAEYLIKIGLEIQNAKWIARGNAAVDYTLAAQLENGAFDYNGPPEKPTNLIDNYHTGFVLRMLYSIWELTQRNDVFRALEKCYSHYIQNFFENDEIPKFKPDRKYRIDIHSCAESINCLSELSPTFTMGNLTAGKVLNWTINHLQDKSGYFYYGILKSRFTRRPFTSKIAYIRWAQAWMLKAMVNYIKFAGIRIE